MTSPLTKKTHKSNTSLPKPQIKYKPSQPANPQPQTRIIWKLITLQQQNLSSKILKLVMKLQQTTQGWQHEFFSIILFYPKSLSDTPIILLLNIYFWSFSTFFFAHST